MENLLENKKKEERLLLLVAFFFQATDYFFSLALVFHLKLYFNLDSLQIGIFVATILASYFVCCLAFERFYENLRPAISIGIGCFGIIIVSLFFGFCKNLNILFLLLIIYGFSKSFFWPQLGGLLTRGLEGKALNRETGRFSFAWSFAAGVSPMFSGFVASKSTILPFFVAVGIMLIALILIFVNTSARKEPSDKLNKQHEKMLDHSTYIRYFAWLGLFLGSFTFMLIQVIFPIYALKELYFSTTTIGVLISLEGFVIAFSFIFFGHFDFWHFKIGWIFLFQALLSGTVLALSYMKTVLGFAIAFVLIGISYSAIYSQSIFHGMSGTANKSKRMMIHEVVLAISAVAAAVIGGAVYKNSNWITLLLDSWKCLALVLVLEVIFYDDYKRNRTISKMLSWNKKKGKPKAKGKV